MPRRVLLLAALAVGGLLLRPGFEASAAEGIPADGASAHERLNASPRHGEWVDIRDGEDSISAWVSYPERADKAPVVVVVHTIAGLNDWPRGVADQLAADGFIGIAPDFLSGKGPGGSNTPEDRQDAVKLTRSLDSAEVSRRISAAVRYGASLPAATKKFGVVGFCWGGGVVFDYAAENPELGASVVYYGRSTATERLKSVEAPILGHYGGSDARVNATIPEAAAELKRLGKFYEKHIYPGAGHGFLGRQDGQDGANLEASTKAWPRTVEFLKQRLEE